MTKLRVCFVGDSITSGQNDLTYLGWPGRVGVDEAMRGHDLTVYNLGIRSDTSAHIDARWEQEARSRLPTELECAVVFAFGINDATEELGRLRVPLPESLAMAERIFVRATKFWPCLWVGPTPVDEAKQPSLMDSGELRTKRNATIGEYSAAYAALSHRIGVPYLDLFDLLSRDPKWPTGCLSDGVHPHAEGYEMLARIFGAWSPWRSLMNEASLRAS
jgi:lysophospholipase L1-like esterase